LLLPYSGKLETPDALPDGFRYEPEFISPAEESTLVQNIERLEFSPVIMHGVTAKRRVAHFGYLYGYETWRVTLGAPIPDWLHPLRDQAAAYLGIPPSELPEALVTAYPPGAGIGWHRDAPPFGVVVALSLLGSCRLRFQRGKGPERITAQIEVARRSVYALTGPSRTQWQHSIPATKALRYSVTFRTMRKRPAC
jgi:alkylated DNA repair protein (DNA oxidative demethylase)